MIIIDLNHRGEGKSGRIKTEVFLVKFESYLHPKMMTDFNAKTYQSMKVSKNNCSYE